MKKLTKEQVYVLIDNQPDCDRVIEQFRKYDFSFSFITLEGLKHLVPSPSRDEILFQAISETRKLVTLDELERILMPKKQLTKKDLPIGTKVVPHDKTVKGCVNFNECDCWNTDKAQKQGFLYVSGYTTDGELKLNEYPNRTQGNFYKYSDVTLYEEQPKIKKAELLERLIRLEEYVKELIDNPKVTIVHPAEFVGDSTKEFKVVFGDTGQEEEKPAFEVGKVYKCDSSDSLLMFYCNRLDENRAYGFGFSTTGYWLEVYECYKNDITAFTEATPEEWFKRLEEEAKKRYPNGCEVNCLHHTKFNKIDTLDFTALQPSPKCLRHRDSEGYLCCVMQDGKWAEIIEEPQHQAGTLGAFWDGEWNGAVNYGRVYVGYFESKQHGVFKARRHPLWWQNFKPLKFD